MVMTIPNFLILLTIFLGGGLISVALALFGFVKLLSKAQASR